MNDLSSASTLSQSFATDTVYLDTNIEFMVGTQDRDIPSKYLSLAVVLTAMVLSSSASAGENTLEPARWNATRINDDVNLVEAKATRQRSILATKIMSYGSLNDGWDGEGGVVPSKMAIGNALSFLDLLPMGASLPKAMVSGEGEVGFYWKSNNGYIDVGFLDDNTISYYGRVNSENLEEGDAALFSGTSLPTELIKIIELI